MNAHPTRRFKPSAASAQTEPPTNTPASGPEPPPPCAAASAPQPASQSERSVMHPEWHDPEWRYYHGAWGG
jgi:hypothetical protein